MLALLLSACLGQDFGPPRIINPFARSTGVRVAPGRADVEVFDGGFLVAWADDRRLTNLARTPITGGEDVWVRLVRGRPIGTVVQRAQLVCPGAGVTAGPRLAVSPTTGLTGLAWSDDRGVSLATLDQNGVWGAGPCGLLVSRLSTDLVEVSPRGAGFAVVHSGVSSLLQTNVFGSAISVPTTRRPTRPSTVVAVRGVMDNTVIGALTNPFLLLDYEPSPVLQVVDVDAFDLVEGTPGPVVALIRGSGLFMGNPDMIEYKTPASSRRPPHAVAIDGGVLVLSATQVGVDSQLFSSASGQTTRSSVAGLPEGLAVTADQGVALFSTSGGVLAAIGVQPAPAFMGIPVPVSSADVIQRRPTLAWSPVDVGWELVWEEATTATTFASRHTLIRLQGNGASSELFITGGWPRVFPQFDGGVGYMSLEGQVTTFSLPGDAGTEPVDQLDASVEGVVASAIGGFGWTGRSTPLGLHQEFTLRNTQLPIEAFLPDEVTCATWFEGSYVVTRRGDGGATIATFPDDRPPVAGVAMAGQLACVAPGRGELGIALADGRGLWVSTPDAGWRVPFDAGVRDLQLTSVAGRWLVVWDTEDALRAAVISRAEGVRELGPIDTHPQALRGVPSLATSPIGAAVVAWPVLEGDSVELRVRVLPLTSITPVFDAGVVDGGVVLVDAGVNDDGGVQADGGVGVDGGVPDEAVRFVPVCGCASVSDALWWLVALVVARRRRGPVMQ